VNAFCGGSLDDGAVKRIGFGEVVRTPILVERTLAEVAGALTKPYSGADPDPVPSL
jgi:hypothetical protein